MFKLSISRGEAGLPASKTKISGLAADEAMPLTKT